MTPAPAPAPAPPAPRPVMPRPRRILQVRIGGGRVEVESVPASEVARIERELVRVAAVLGVT